MKNLYIVILFFALTSEVIGSEKIIYSHDKILELEVSGGESIFRSIIYAGYRLPHGVKNNWEEKYIERLKDYNKKHNSTAVSIDFDKISKKLSAIALNKYEKVIKKKTKMQLSNSSSESLYINVRNILAPKYIYNMSTTYFHIKKHGGVISGCDDEYKTYRNKPLPRICLQVFNRKNLEYDVFLLKSIDSAELIKQFTAVFMKRGSGWVFSELRIDESLLSDARIMLLSRPPKAFTSVY